MSSPKVTFSNVSSPSTADEYVLVKKSASADSKETKVTSDMIAPKLSVGSLLSANSSGSYRCFCNYDFAITPSTTAALATWSAVSVNSDTQASSYWKYLFSNFRINRVVLELDFHEYMNMVGVADKFSPLAISFRSTTSPSIPGYTSITDDQTCKLVNWSQANPIFRFDVTPKLLNRVWATDSGQMGVSKAGGVSYWIPLESSNLSRGYIHICSYDTFNAGTSGRRIICRLKYDVTFSNKL